MSLYTSKLNFEESSDDGREKQIRVAVGGHTDFVIYGDLVPCEGYFTSTFEVDVVPSV